MKRKITRKTKLKRYTLRVEIFAEQIFAVEYVKMCKFRGSYFRSWKIFTNFAKICTLRYIYSNEPKSVFWFSLCVNSSFLFNRHKDIYGQFLEKRIIRELKFYFVVFEHKATLLIFYSVREENHLKKKNQRQQRRHWQQKTFD